MKIYQQQTDIKFSILRTFLFFFWWPFSFFDDPVLWDHSFSITMISKVVNLDNFKHLIFQLYFTVKLHMLVNAFSAKSRNRNVWTGSIIKWNVWDDPCDYARKRDVSCENTSFWKHGIFLPRHQLKTCIFIQITILIVIKVINQNSKIFVFKSRALNAHNKFQAIVAMLCPMKLRV